MDAVKIIDQIISGNTAFVECHDLVYFKSHMTKQEPFLTLVSCSDSRVPRNALLPDTVNKVFSIENIGNQILSSEGSIDYGIYHLRTPVLMILGHSDCGAIKAYMQGFDKETYNIKRDLDFLKPMFSKFTDETDIEKNLALTIQENVDYQVNVASKKYRNYIKKGQLIVLGAYYDFKNEFGKGFGRIIIVNVNKIKEKEKILELPVMKNISSKIHDFYIDRFMSPV